MRKLRFTARDLEQKILETNQILVDSGSVYFYEIGSAYGDTQVNRCYIDPEGKRRNLSNVEMGSPRQCDQAMTSDHYNYLGAKHVKAITRKTAKGVLSLVINFSKDCVQLNHYELMVLSKWAKLTKYRKSKTSSMSTGAAFFNHLKNKVII